MKLDVVDSRVVKLGTVEDEIGSVVESIAFVVNNVGVLFKISVVLEVSVIVEMSIVVFDVVE